MDLIGTIEVALFGGAGNNVEDVEKIFSSLMHRSYSLDYEIIEDGEFVQIDIYGSRHASSDTMDIILAELQYADFDAYIIK
jgi:hypothetical protein